MLLRSMSQPHLGEFRLKCNSRVCKLSASSGTLFLCPSNTYAMISGGLSSATDCKWVLVQIQVSHLYVYCTQCYTKRNGGFCLVGKTRGRSGLSQCLGFNS